MKSAAKQQLEGLQEHNWSSSASGEREQKRLYSGPGPDGEAWAYYLLAGRTQHAVYHGMQTVACEQPSTMVFIAPVEYLGYGGGEGLVRYDPTGTRTYTISDHLGSLRALVNDTGTVIRSVDYAPFGDVYAENGQATRREFLNLERDRESALGDHGVRKYDAELGRFISVDPLWEAYAGFSPYQYGANSPLRVVDVDGRKLVVHKEDEATWNETIAYLRTLETVNIDRIIQDLEESPQVYELRLVGAHPGQNDNNGFAFFDGGYGVVEWDPNMALAYMAEDMNGSSMGWQSRSPAIGLLHELTHAWLSTFASSRHGNLENALGHIRTRDRWKDAGERHIIQEVENPAILESGEALYGRPGWRGVAQFNYEVVSSVSTEPIPGASSGNRMEKE